MLKTRWGLLAALALCAAAGSTVIAQETKKPADKPEKFTIDKPTRDFKLKDLFYEKKEDDKPEAEFISLSQFKGKKAIVLYFMSENCGTTRLYDKRVGDLVKEYTEKDLQVMGVRCSAADTPEGLKKWVEAKNFNIPLLNDEKGALTSYFKVTRTPTFVLIDKKGVVRYWGSFDDTGEEEQVSERYLPKAVVAVMENQPIKEKQTRPFG